MLEEVAEYDFELSLQSSIAQLSSLSIQPSLVSRVIEAQQADQTLQDYRAEAASEDQTDWQIGSDGGLRFRGRLCVSDIPQLRRDLMDEAHRSRFTIHPGSTKMYRDMRRQYFWAGMKRQIASFVAECDTCQRVKADHRKPPGPLQPLSVPLWKWEHVTTDFIMGLPRTDRGHDAIWVVVDRLTKSAHFLAIRATWSLD